MTDMKPLLDSSGSPRAIALLEAGLHDAPGPDVASRVAVALGALGGVTAASGASAAAAAATSLPLTAGSGASAALSSMIVKWLLIGALVGSAGSGAMVALVPRAGEAVAPPPAVSHASAPLDRASLSPSANGVPAAALELARPAAPRATAVADAPAPRAGPSPVVSAPASKAGSVVGSSLVGASNAATLGDGPSRLRAEIAMIDSARRAVSAADPRGALDALDAYDEKQQTGVLDREARLLRIDALALAGDRAAAIRLASAYMKDFPGDPHAVQLRPLLSGVGP